MKDKSSLQAAKKTRRRMNILTLEDESESDDQSNAPSEESVDVLFRYMGLTRSQYMKGERPKRPMILSTTKEVDNSSIADDVSECPTETSMTVLMRYMGCSSRPYMSGPKREGSTKKKLEDIDKQYKHDLQEGDHVIRWKMLGYCYPIQVHGIVFSAGPDVVTIVDCGLASSSSSSSDNSLGKVTNLEEKDNKNAKKTRRRMNILTLVDEKEIRQWTKIRYGEEVQLKVHSSNKEMQQHAEEKGVQGECVSQEISDSEIAASPSAGLELEEVEKCVQANIKPTPKNPNPNARRSPKRSWFSRSCNSSAVAEDVDESEFKQENAKQKSPKLRIPNTDPPKLVLARLRFLLEYGEEAFPPPSGTDANDNNSKDTTSRPNLLPSHHLLYSNSECIAVWCKTGSWSTLQAAIFLHSSTVGNAKQTATVAMFLSAQTVTVPASGFWGFFGGTTTISLFAAQPWVVPALVGGGMVYIGLPMVMLRKAKGRWGDAEKRLNDAFWSMCNSDVIVELIRCWSGLEG
ncbi:hypothetical protein ACHAXR_013181 [Thalassiosira sp. AJA248-18]